MNDLVIPDRKLALIEQGRYALAEAKSVPEAKTIRDQAAAIEYYLKEQSGSAEAALLAAELKLRAERRLGELLEKTAKAKGVAGAGRPPKGGRTVEPPKTGRKLSDLGITKTQSHRWQQVASTPATEFEQHINRAKADKARSELTTTAVLRATRKEERGRRVDTLASATHESGIVAQLTDLASSGKKFGTIYVDPPWAYDNKGTRAAAAGEYPTMTLDEIAALPVGEIAAKQCHLHLWTTNAFLFDCQRLFDAWGFEYKSVFVWVKDQLGIGNYWRVSHEILLLGVRGGLTFPNNNIKSWIAEPRTKHSAKPDRIRKLIEKVSPGPRIELFARDEHDGWQVWGNEVAKRHLHSS